MFLSWFKISSKRPNILVYFLKRMENKLIWHEMLNEKLQSLEEIENIFFKQNLYIKIITCL